MLAAEVADQTRGGIEPHPLMTPAEGLAVPSNLLGVTLVEVDQTLHHEDGPKADDHGKQANVNPGEGHFRSLQTSWQMGLGWLKSCKISESNLHASFHTPRRVLGSPFRLQ
jgi:hypothetical protein